MTDVYETICRRRSIRRFRQEPVPDAVLGRLVNAARLAPSGGNRQPCEYIIVDEARLVDSLFPFLKWAAYIAPEGDPPEGERPMAYIVVLVDTARKDEGSVDAAAAMMSMILTAEAEGIGSCWIGSVDRDALRRLFLIPDSLAIDSVLALGYPKESPVAVKSEKIRYWKSTDGVLHVPKRSVEAVSHRNGYEHRIAGR